ALSGCTGADDPTPDYRYRLRVEVETPEGLKTGSSVIAVEQRLGRSGSSPLNRAIRYRVRGEAVAVDLPGGQTLFALLRSENDVQWSARVMQMLAPDIDGEEWEDVFDNVLLLEGPVEVPRRWTEDGLMKGQSAYPMLVTFGDEADPTSVERVDPDDLSASFGEGVELQRITVELTDEPVTTGIEERLGWLSETQGAIGKIPMSERPPSGIALPLHATLSETAFRKRAKK
ncbi:MAG: hypothetical protein QNI87_08520, partial [Erythrobacter sp.]|uniref:hypothetical protein n=1 Tax=Erythrobacter sp. TaxID=1042 RepID=UPI0026183E0D